MKPGIALTAALALAAAGCATRQPSEIERIMAEADKLPDTPGTGAYPALTELDPELEGYVVYRHLREPHSRVTQIVDLMAEPADERGIKTLARWVDREARMNDSDKIRCHVTNAAFRRVLRRSGYFIVKSGIDLTVKVNAVPVPKGFYDSADDWHFTLGDGEMDH